MAGIFKVLVAVGSSIQRCDAIEYDGGTWIVPAWYEQPQSGLQKPARIIRVDQLGLTDAPPGTGARYLASLPVPTELFDVSTPLSPSDGFEVVDLPPILLNADGSPSDQGVDIDLGKPN